MNSSILIRAAVIVIALWAGVAVVRGLAKREVATSENFLREVHRSGFGDSSGDHSSFTKAQLAEREEKLRALAGTMNRMDFQEREKLRLERADARFFDRLSQTEKKLWIDLTLKESMDKMMLALDAMPEDQRRDFVEKGLAELERGLSEEDMKRFKESDSGLVDRITKEGLRAFYENAGADTKLDLAPLMESMNEVLQGLRGQQFGPPS